VVNQGGAPGLFLRISDAPRDFLRAHAVQKGWNSAVRDYALALAREPSTRAPGVFSDGGVALAELGRWKEAAIAFNRLIEFAPANYWGYHDLFHVSLALGDREAYRRAYKQALERFGTNTDPGISRNLVPLAILTPDTMESKTAYDDLLRRARTMIDTKNVDWRSLSLYGSLLYRAGQSQSAVNFLNRSMRDPKNHGSALDYVFMAMAAHRLKQAGDETALKRAVELANNPSLDWTERVALRALIKEAETELKAPKAR
jgi:tetratricopeptide (TPR) repeat protein